MPPLLSTFLLYRSAKCRGLVKCCQSLIFFSPSDSRVMAVVIEGVRVLSFSLMLQGFKGEILTPFTRQPIAPLLLFPYFFTPPFFPPSPPSPVSLNKWHQQAMK